MYPRMTAVSDWVYKGKPLQCFSDPFIQRVTIFPYLKASFEMDNPHGCSPFTVTLRNSSVGFEDYNYSVEGKLITSGSLGDDLFFSIPFHTKNMYHDEILPITLTVTSPYNCKDWITKQITVFSAPKADFLLGSPWPDTDCINPFAPIQIDNLIPYSDRERFTYQWSWNEAGMPFEHIFSNTATPEPVEFPYWGVFNVTMLVSNIDEVSGYVKCSDSKSLTIKIPPSSNIFVQRWHDVLAINNNFATNGGYVFTEYEWYKDGVKLPSTKGYIHEPGGLSPTAEYTAVLTTHRGDKITTCPAKITDMKVKSAVYPNPVKRGQSVYVETGLSSGEAVMQLFGASGNFVTSKTLYNPVAEITMPDTPGAYVLQITVNGTVKTYKIVVE